nr:hypothetical protein CFP56_56830 [Quercus suber]
MEPAGHTDGEEPIPAKTQHHREAHLSPALKSVSSSAPNSAQISEPSHSKRMMPKRTLNPRRRKKMGPNKFLGANLRTTELDIGIGGLGKKRPRMWLQWPFKSEKYDIIKGRSECNLHPRDSSYLCHHC